MTDDVGDRSFGAIERGNYEAVESLRADDVTVWHSGDAQDDDRGRAPSHPIADANPGTWVLDPARSTVTFRNKIFWVH